MVQPTEAIDPFESATFGDPPQALTRAQSPPQRVATPQQHREPLGYSVSTEAESEALSDDEDADESQLFPGSDLF